MASASEKVPLERRFRHGMRVYRAYISLLVLGIGILLSVLAIGRFTPLSGVGPFPTINGYTVQPDADYNLVFVVAGPIIFIIGLYLVGAYYYARRKFEHLMVTKSKAEFLRNIPELEEILWDLTPADEVRYERKRADLRLRR